MSKGDAIATATDLRGRRILQLAGWPLTRFGGVERIGEAMNVTRILSDYPARFERVCPPGYPSGLRRLQRLAA